MKTRRIKMNTGDVFLAPFDQGKAIYSQKWNWQWEPQKGDECFLMQNIGMNNRSSSLILTALFDKIYHYNIDTDNIDVSELEVIAIVDVIDPSFTVGEFKKIDNQLIPENMPYMAYNRFGQYITPLPSCDVIVPYIEKKHNHLPPSGLSVMGGRMYGISEYLIKDIFHPEYSYDFYYEPIESTRVRPDAAVHRFFPEAKNDPNWVISQYNDPKLQDREKYEK